MNGDLGYAVGNYAGVDTASLLRAVAAQPARAVKGTLVGLAADVVLLGGALTSKEISGVYPARWRQARTGWDGFFRRQD